MIYITELLNHYGYIVLFFSLMIELIAFPVPGETLMTYCGFLVFQGKLNLVIGILASTFGVICGITISYFIGRILGNTFLKRYGSYIHLGPKQLEKTSKWFEKYGNGLLIVAFFIPGVRHVTGYFSGITKISYKRFALNAYIGALIWTGTFIFLGNTLGWQWNKLNGTIRKYSIILGIILIIALIFIYLYKNYKLRITIFHSLGEKKIIIASTAVIFMALSIYIVFLIQYVL